MRSDRLDRGALHDRQQIALHALPRHVGPLATPLARRHLVDLVDEDDPRLLDARHRQLAHSIRVHQARRLLVDESLEGRRHLEAAAARLLGHEAAEQILELDAHLLDALGREDRHGRGHLELARCRDGLWQQRIEQALLGSLLGLGLHGRLLLGGHQVDGELDQVPDDGLDVAPDVSHLGELGRLHLEERSLGETRQAPSDLGLAHTGGPDHDDVLGSDFVP
jgi:hypothetical protein